MSSTDSRRRARIMLVLFAGMLMGALDIAIVGPALPAIQAAFDADARAVSWIFTIYVLLNLIGTPLLGKLSDAFGRRPVYILSVTIFAAGSLIVALAPAFGVVLVGRAVQGFGAGGIFPVASAVIGDTFPPEQRGRALGLIGAVFGLAFLVGPILGGVLLLLSWHWLFLVNLPVAAAIIVAAQRILPASRPPARRPFDWPGIAVLAGLLAALAYGLNQIETTGTGAGLFAPAVWPYLALAGLALPLFWWIERRAPDPILRVGLFGSRQVALVVAFALGAGITEAAVVFAPRLLTLAFHVSESTASFMLLPIVLTLAVGAPLAGRLLDSAGSRVVVLGGNGLVAAGMVLAGLWGRDLAAFYVAAALIGVGLGGLLGAPLRYILLGEAGPAERGAAQGALALFTSSGQLIGGALVGALAASRGGGVDGYLSAYLVIGGIAAGLAVLALGLKRRAAERATLHRSANTEGEAARPAA